jgi:hypothetical protein
MLVYQRVKNDTITSKCKDWHYLLRKRVRRVCVWGFSKSPSRISTHVPRWSDKVWTTGVGLDSRVSTGDMINCSAITRCCKQSISCSVRFLSFIYLYACVHVDILSPMIVVLSCLLRIVFVLVPTWLILHFAVAVLDAGLENWESARSSTKRHQQDLVHSGFGCSLCSRF